MQNIGERSISSISVAASTYA